MADGARWGRARRLLSRTRETVDPFRLPVVALALILSMALGPMAPPCSWAHPGANPYRGNPVAALADFDLPAPTRRKLAGLMAAHRYTDVAAITRDTISGAQDYTDLREMHSGRGQVCHGGVDRSAWAPGHTERGLVYCADDACVIVPTICNNVSLVTRRPPVAAADEPLDIEPAAGPPMAADAPLVPADVPGDLMPDTGPLAFLPPTEAGPWGPGGGGGAPGGGGAGPLGGDLPGLPGGAGPGDGSEPVCCVSGPGGPGGTVTPGTPGGSSPIPEPPAWLLSLAGVAWLGRRKG